jgi:hypothetical protein
LYSAAAAAAAVCRLVINKIDEIEHLGGMEAMARQAYGTHIL